MQLQDYLQQPLLRISTAGSVDDGKSTLIGRLLYDSKALFEDTIQAVSRASARDFPTAIDFSLFSDGLKAEREQKITIDVAYRFFSTPKAHFILADTPGHEEYTRNMATGASLADVGIILMDAQKGVLTQTRRHAFIMNLLGIKHLVIAVNKMDTVDFKEDHYRQIKEDFARFSSRFGCEIQCQFVPVCALWGDNIVHRSTRMDWYAGPTIIQFLENLLLNNLCNLQEFRFPVQLVSRPHSNFRGYAGTVLSGVVRRGDAVLVLPSMQASSIGRIVSFDGDLEVAFAPMAVTLELNDAVDVGRGDMLVHPDRLPQISSHFAAELIWLAEPALDLAKSYLLKQACRWEKCRITELYGQVALDTLDYHPCQTLQQNQIGHVRIQANKPLLFDAYTNNRSTGAFVLVDLLTNQTVAAGMISERLSKEDLVFTVKQDNRQYVIASTGFIQRSQREKLLGQRAVTVWMTGLSGAGKTTIAIDLERHLFSRGKLVYRLDGDNLRHGLNSNLGFTPEDRQENVRRVAEVAKLMNDAGIIVVVSLISPFAKDREEARQIVGAENFLEVFVDAPLAVCQERDTKGFYQKALANQIKNFTGISSPYEVPDHPDLQLKTAEQAVAACVQMIVDRLSRDKTFVNSVRSTT